VKVFSQIVLSVDYEIFGNGTGDVRQHIIDPTERMARICEEHHVPLCIFFEVEEYLGFVRHRDVLKNDLGYDPATLIRDQIVSLMRRGHDVQLHLHPQWYNATYRDRQWQLNWNWPSVDHLFEKQDQVDSYIGERKALIDGMYADAGVPRTVTAYRAGAFCAQPAQMLLPALAANSFVIESSVVVGLHRKGKFGDLDFRHAPANRSVWPVNSDVCVPDSRGSIFEMPVGSVIRRRYRQINLRRLAAKFSRNVPRQRQREMIESLGIKRSPLGIARFLWQQFPIKFDYHNVAPRTLCSWINSRPEMSREGDLDPVVLIGHTKEHTDDNALRDLLGLLARNATLRVVGYNDLAQALPQVGSEVRDRAGMAVPNC
jgi:hypothetical protein